MELICETIVFFLLVSPSLGTSEEFAQNFITIAGPLPSELVNRLYLQNQVLPKEDGGPTVAEADGYLCQKDLVAPAPSQYFSQLRELGVTHYKLFLPWARVLPTGDAKKPDEAQVRCYRELLQTLVAADLRPVVVLHHQRVPGAVAAQVVGGKVNAFADLFVEYAEFSFRVFGDLVDVWLTFSDLPEVLQSLPHEDPRGRAQALAAAHGRAYTSYHEKYSPAGKENGERDFLYMTFSQIFCDGIKWPLLHAVPF